MTPRVTHVPASGLRTMPWRNGGGTTTELAIEPPGARLESGFDWRVSVAEVASSGPFSAFAGHTRTIALVAGAGITLVFPDGERHRLDEPLVPFEFDGARALTGELHGGPIRDFNLIRDPERVDAKLCPIRGDTPSQAVETAGGCVLVACLAGSLDVDVGAPLGAWRLAAGDLLRVDDAGAGLRVVLGAAPPGALGMLVDLARIADR